MVLPVNVNLLCIDNEKVEYLLVHVVFCYAWVLIYTPSDSQVITRNGVVAREKVEASSTWGSCSSRVMSITPE